MTTLRSYRDACGVARGLDLVGERWALLVVRELLLGPRRFTDLRGALPGASATVLSQRLRELNRAGVIRHARLAPPSRASVYELTAHGAELEPILIALGVWALRSPAADAEASLSAVSAMLALRTYFAPNESWTADYDVRLGDQEYSVRVVGRWLDVRQGHADNPVSTIRTDPKNFLALLGGQKPTAATVNGDRDAAARLLAAVSLPT